MAMHSASVVVAQGVRQTPSRHTRPDAQSLSIVQKGVRSQLGRQNSSAAQYAVLWAHVPLAWQSTRQRPSTQCSPLMQSSLEEQSWRGRQNEPMQASPVAQSESALQTTVHSLFMQTWPPGHSRSSWQVLPVSTHWFSMQSWFALQSPAVRHSPAPCGTQVERKSHQRAPVHSLSLVQVLEPVHVPSSQYAPEGQSPLVRQLS